MSSHYPAGATAPFKLPSAAFARLPGVIGFAARVACDRLLAFPTLNALYDETCVAAPTEPFCARALAALRVQLDVSDADLERVPTTGPLIVVANHPFGGLDGIVLTALLQRIRPDVRLLANFLLRSIPEMHDTCLFVDPFGGPTATIRNRGAMKAALRWVTDGGVLGVFPAGEVSHFTLQNGCVTDPPWSDSVARLVQAARATVVPIFFDGRNSSLFQIAGLFHPRLRTALLPRELLRHRGRAVHIEIGSPIPFERLVRTYVEERDERRPRRAGAAQLIEYLRFRTYILKGRTARTRPHARHRSGVVPTLQPVVPAVPPADIAADVAALPEDQCLSVSGALRVYFGSATQLPNVLREIGRLREVTFRLVGEGTGRAIDLDHFDPQYLHLFVWNAAAQQIVGAYRLGQTDVLLERSGAAGLYTSTLFDFHQRLLAQLNPALELGRSFVIPEYQRDYTPLSLLWKGIGRFVVRHPRYRRLFGPVSISDAFHSMTKQILMAFLRTHSFDHELAALVHPKHPPRRRRFRDADERRLATLVADIGDVDELVREIESNQRHVPILLRQYLRLNAKLLGFNIDPDFGDVLDGLILVDLPTVPRPILDRYLGKEGAATFLAHHSTVATVGF